MTTRSMIAAVTFALVGLMLGACTTPQPGVTNQLGTFTARYEASPQQVTEAARDVLEDMDLVIISSAATEVDGQVVARTAQDTKVNVTVERVADDLSEVSVRVGTLGDEDVSLTILDRIEERLE